MESSTSTPAARCPVHGASPQKTAPIPHAGPAVVRSSDGVWHVHGFAETRAVLRSDATLQAGFMAETVRDVPGLKHQPVLFQDGEEHHAHRAETARFFTPATVSAKYRGLMEGLSDRLVAGLKERGRADLSRLSMDLAVSVAAEVVGLTSSVRPGMARRIERFLEGEDRPLSGRVARLLAQLRNRLDMLAFYLLDVRPAIRARRKKPGEDVISHLLSRGRSDPEILIECVTYGAAGMVTTREFICAAAWHLLEHPELRDLYLRSDEADRHRILGEFLRLEPVVGELFRRTTQELPLETGGGTLTIPAGSLIALHLYDANADERVTGECPREARPFRELPRSVQPPVASFGDGHHRCPGAYVAIQESDIFLTRLLAVPGLTLERSPRVGRNEIAKGYELRDFVLSVRA